MEYTHTEWIKSLRENDGRQWIIEEDPVLGSRYFQFDPVDKARLEGTEGKAAERKRKVREQMTKKTWKDGKPFVWQLGYNHCIGRFTGSDTYPTLSGSSLNRKKKPRKKQEKKEPTAGVVHVFSNRSRGKVKDKGMAFFRSMHKDRTFLTLTFIQDIPDKKGVQILNKFLTMLRKENKGLQYLWVAEHQEDTRTTIHFHMILNRRLPIKRYNALWVLQQYNQGLIGHRKDGEAISKQEIEQRYTYDMNSKFRRKDQDSVMAVLNPFHIEKAYNIHGLSYYLTKYITLQKQKDEFGCLNWHCSRRVSKLFTKEVVSWSTFAYLHSFANYKVDRNTGECMEPRTISQKFFTMVYVNNKAAALSRLRQLEQVNKWLMNEFDPDGIPTIDNEFYKKSICKN